MGAVSAHPAAVPDPARPGVEVLAELCRRLAELTSWDRSVGDDAPRFGLLLEEHAQRLAALAERLARDPALAGDAELARRVAVVRAAASRSRSEGTSGVIEAVHEVAERAEDVLDVTWARPAGPDTTEVQSGA